MPRGYNIPDWLNEAYLKKMDEVLELFQEPFEFAESDDDVLQALDESIPYGTAWLGLPPRVRNPDEKIVWIGEGWNIGAMALLECEAWIVRRLLPQTIRECTFVPVLGVSVAESGIPLYLVKSVTPSEHNLNKLNEIVALMNEREVHLVVSFLELMTLRVGFEEGDLAKIALNTFWYKLSPKGAPSEDE